MILTIDHHHHQRINHNGTTHSSLIIDIDLIGSLRSTFKKMYVLKRSGEKKCDQI